MKKNTKIFNTEVIERLALSDNIPPFDEQRKGTQVIMTEEGKKTVIYDDYSMYCDADARKWRVEAYNRTDGRKYDRLCMCGGVYPTRKRAIAEIDRFAYRAMGCSGLSRVDFFLMKDGTVILNEINTLPGHTPISMYPQLMQYEGMTPAQQEDKLIKLALDKAEVDYE